MDTTADFWHFDFVVGSGNENMKTKNLWAKEPIAAY